MKTNEIKTRSNGGISIRVIGGVTTAIAIAFAFYAFALAGQVGDAQKTLAENEKRYIECNEAINDLQSASDFLTSQARSYVITGRKTYMNAYISEIEDTDRRGKSVELLSRHFTEDDRAATALKKALSSSDALAHTELAAMKLAASHYGLKELPPRVEKANPGVYRRESDNSSDFDLAKSLVLGTNYDEAKKAISLNVEASSIALLKSLDGELQTSKTLVENLLFQLRISVALLLCVIMVLVLAVFMYVLQPLSRYVKRISKNEPLNPDGAYELHYLANAYNTMYEDNSKRIEQLRAFAERDTLTGISNRGGYDNFLATHTRNIALLLIDIDNFKEYNMVYGHDTGDAVLVSLAGALTDAFRSTDFPCRIDSEARRSVEAMGRGFFRISTTRAP